MAHVSFAILGPQQIQAGTVAAVVGSPMERAALAVLLLAEGRPVSLSTFTGALWRRPPRSAAANLRTYVSHLRAALRSVGPALGDRLEVARDGAGYRLVADPTEADVYEFTRLAREGRECLRAGNPAAAEAALDRACALWRGPTSEGVPDSVTGSIVPRLRSLDEQRLIAREDLVDARLALHHHAAVLPEVAAMSAGHPLRERPWAQLMVVRYRTAGAGAALATFRQARAVLAEQLGVEPGADLCRLQAAILRRDDAAIGELHVTGGR